MGLVGMAERVGDFLGPFCLQKMQAKYRPYALTRLKSAIWGLVVRRIGPHFIHRVKIGV